MARASNAEDSKGNARETPPMQLHTHWESPAQASHICDTHRKGYLWSRRTRHVQILDRPRTAHGSDPPLKQPQRKHDSTIFSTLRPWVIEVVSSYNSVLSHKHSGLVFSACSYVYEDPIRGRGRGHGHVLLNRIHDDGLYHVSDDHVLSRVDERRCRNRRSSSHRIRIRIRIRNCSRLRRGFCGICSILVGSLVSFASRVGILIYFRIIVCVLGLKKGKRGEEGRVLE